MTYYIGIDPGITGAACLIRYPEIQILDWDGTVSTAIKIGGWKLKYDIVGAFIEHVNAMPRDKNHMVSMAKLIRNAGHWEGILSAFEIPIKRISPTQWRKGLYAPCDKRPFKKRSLDAARELFPDYGKTYFSRVKDHNRAEAALIAYQAERYFNQCSRQIFFFF